MNTIQQRIITEYRQYKIALRYGDSTDPYYTDLVKELSADRNKVFKCRACGKLCTVFDCVDSEEATETLCIDCVVSAY